jgi:hypothetical protein
MTHETTPGTWALVRFFAPVAIQAAAQAFCYPLVAMVASRAAGGPLNLAGMAQSITIMFFLGMFAIYFITTGMVFADSRRGFEKFRQVVLATGVAVTVIQAVICLPPISRLVFEKLIGLPLTIAAPARVTLLASIPLQLLFFLRVPYFVAMYVGRASGRASLATIGRVAVTALLSPIFCFLGWVGPLWAILCLTLPVAMEVVIARWFAARFISVLGARDTAVPTARDIFWFNLPLAMGGYFLAISGVALGAFIARAPDPERILPVYYLALGLANPAAFAATRIQTVVLAYPPPATNFKQLRWFAAAVGIVLGLLPLICVLPGIAERYYVMLQNLPITDLPLVRLTALSLVFFPLGVAIRARNEGIAAWQKKPSAVLKGHILFMVTIMAVGTAALIAGIPGYFIGALGLSMGNLASAAVIRMGLKRSREGVLQAGQTTTTSVGQIR